MRGSGLPRFHCVRWSCIVASGCCGAWPQVIVDTWLPVIVATGHPGRCCRHACLSLWPPVIEAAVVVVATWLPVVMAACRCGRGSSWLLVLIAAAVVVAASRLLSSLQPPAHWSLW